MPEVLITCSPPKSYNRTAGENRYTRHRRKRRAQSELELALLAVELPRPLPGDRVHATATIYSPTARTRDEGNFRAPLEKALGDALVPKLTKRERDELRTLGLPPAPRPRYLTEDTPAHFTFGALDFGTRPRRPQSCVVRLVWGPELALESYRSLTPLLLESVVVEVGVDVGVDSSSVVAAYRVGDTIGLVDELHRWGPERLERIAQLADGLPVEGAGLSDVLASKAIREARS